MRRGRQHAPRHCQPRGMDLLLAAFESFATAFRLKTAESAVCLRRFLSDQTEMFEHDALGNRHEAIAVLPDPEDGDFGARAVSR